MRTSLLPKRIQIIIVAALCALAAGAFMWHFGNVGPSQFGYARDWQMFWQATSGLRIDYSQGWIFNPPWALAFLWPLTLPPVYQGWGLMIFVTCILLALATPRAGSLRRWAVLLLAMLVSYPALRQLSDGNVEFLMLGGFLLLSAALMRGEAWMLAGAFVLLTTKIQESWLALAVAAIWMLAKWPRRRALTAFALSAIFALPFLAWKGSEWLASVARFPNDSHYNSSLIHTLNGLGAPAWLSIAVWIAVFSATLFAIRKRVNEGPLPILGLLVTAGMLLAPYSGNSVLLPFALGVMPLVARKPWPYALLVLLYDLPVLGDQTFRAVWEPLYWAGALAITWFVLIYDALKAKSGSKTRSLF